MKRSSAATGDRPFVTRVAGAVEGSLRALLIALVKGYRLLLSPMLGAGCRFTPSCSAYALQALERHGAGRGSYLTVSRLLRCHPWCAGGVDEVPDVRQPASEVASSGRDARSSSGLFSRLLSPSSQKNFHE